LRISDYKSSETAGFGPLLLPVSAILDLTKIFNDDHVTLAAHVFFDKIGKIHENTRKKRKNITLRYLVIVVVIKYSLLNPRWRKPEVEVIQNRQLYMNSIL